MLSEPRGWCTVNDIMIETDGYTQVFADFDAAIHHTRLFTDAAQSQLEGMVGRRNAPATSRTEHSYGTHQHGAVVFLEQPRILEQSPQKQPPDKSGQPHERLDESGFLAAFVFHLECPDLPMQFADALLVDPSEDMGPDRLFAVHFNLKQHVDIYFIEDDQLVAPVPIGVDALVQVDGFAQAGEEKRRERETFARRQASS